MKMYLSEWDGGTRRRSRTARTRDQVSWFLVKMPRQAKIVGGRVPTGETDQNGLTYK